MSEFQCYQFKAIDRPLTESERKEVGSWSSRAQVSSHSATFIYHYGDFRQDEEKAVEQYFDAMLYFANWGTRRLLLRLPAALTDAKAIKSYCLEDKWTSDYIRLKKKGAFYLLDIYYDNEGGGDWMEEEDFDIGDLSQIRNNLLKGDFSSLYLAWAQFSLHDEAEEEEEEERPIPPVPTNFKHTTGTLKAFIDFFEIDEDLVAAVQSASPGNAAIVPDYEKILRQLPEEEHIQWLIRLLNGDEPQLDLSLKKRLEKMIPQGQLPKKTVLTPAQLLGKGDEEKENRKAREKENAQAAHIQKMQAFEKDEVRIWESVTFNLERSSSKAYELATEALKDLRDLAIYQGREDAFREKMAVLRKEHARRFSLIGRWNKAGL